MEFGQPYLTARGREHCRTTSYLYTLNHGGCGSEIHKRYDSRNHVVQQRKHNVRIEACRDVIRVNLMA